MTASYQTVSAWRGYQRHIPPAFRIEPAESFWPWKGMEVHIDRATAPGARLKLVVLHGGGGYGRMLSPVLAAAVRHGVEALAPDLPGYGLTRTHRQPFDYAAWVDCAADLIAAERARDGLPVLVFGASMGGLLAYSAAARAGAAGVVATCLLDPRDPRVRARLGRAPWLGSLAPSLLSLLRPADRLRVPIRWLANMDAIANDPHLASLCARDPQGGGSRVPLAFLRTFLASAPEVEPERFTACPVLLAHPAADRWTPVELSLPFFDRIAAPKQLALLTNAGHFPVEQPGISELEAAMARFIDEITACGARARASG